MVNQLNNQNAVYKKKIIVKFFVQSQFGLCEGFGAKHYSKTF